MAKASTPRPPATAILPATVSTAKAGVASAVRDEFYIGNPASYRMPLTPKQFWPEIKGKYWSDRASQLYQLFSEIMIKDGIVYSNLEQRKAAVLSLDRRVMPASESEEDIAIAQFVETALEQIGGADGGFNADLRHLLQAIDTGVSVCELEWTVTSLPETPNRLSWVPGEIRHRYTGNFVFDEDGNLFWTGGDVSRREPAAERKFLTLCFDSNFENPYGTGLLQRVWWYYYFKIEAMHAWLISNEKYGMPTAIGRIPAGATDEIKSAVEDIIKKIATETGVIVPEGVTLELLEAKGSGVQSGESPFNILMEYCDDCITRTIVGSTLTSSEGRRSGSLALGKVHQQVADDKVEADARSLEWVINRQLIRWIVDFNFGTEKPCPTWVIQTEEGEDLKSLSATLRELQGMGVRIPEEFIYKKFEIPTPEEGDKVLTIYHGPLAADVLNSGILGNNEVRTEYLGLEPAEEKPEPPPINPLQMMQLAKGNPEEDENRSKDDEDDDTEE